MISLLSDEVALPSPHDPNEVVAKAHEILGSSAYTSLHTVFCEYHHGVLTLRGRVPTYFMKQVAQMLVNRIRGVEHVDNRIYVVDPEVESIRIARL